MAAPSGLDLFSLAGQPDAPASSARAMAWPVALVPVVAAGLVLGLFGGTAADPRYVAAAAAACALTGAVDLLLQRRWHPVRQRLGNAMLSDGDAALGRDWSPLERKVARKAVREHLRRGDGERSWRSDWLGKAMWPVYFIILADGAEGMLEMGGYGIALATVLLGARAARAAYRHDILRPVLARISKRQLMLLEQDAEGSAPAAAGAASSEREAEGSRPARPAQTSTPIA